jgi:hypothetical protein
MVDMMEIIDRHFTTVHDLHGERFAELNAKLDAVLGKGRL